MNSNLSIMGIQLTALRGWIVTGVYAATVTVGTWIFVSAMINAPAARAMIERQDANEIAQENRTFCTKFGMAPDSPALSTCAIDLAQIRQRHEARWMRDFDVFGTAPVAKRP